MTLVIPFPYIALTKEIKMKYLHLDNEFTPFGKSLHYEAFTFNGGEPHIKIVDEIAPGTNILMTCRPKSFNDLGFLFMAHNALTQLNVGDISLLMPYFPGARQDRIMISGEPFSLKVYTRLINGLELKRINIIDPHSDVCPALLKNVHVIENIVFVKEVLDNKTDYTLIAPDAGAMKKTYKVAQALQVSKVVECSKVRDISTGRLSSFKVNADDLENKACVIVDDICDGGGTFIGLAKELKKKNAGPLILIVTHGIFSKGSDHLTEVFDEIYTTDAFKTIKDQNINQIELTTLLNL